MFVLGLVPCFWCVLLPRLCLCWCLCLCCVSPLGGRADGRAAVRPVPSRDETDRPSEFAPPPLSRRGRALSSLVALPLPRTHTGGARRGGWRHRDASRPRLARGRPRTRWPLLSPAFWFELLLFGGATATIRSFPGAGSPDPPSFGRAGDRRVKRGWWAALAPPASQIRVDHVRAEEGPGPTPLSRTDPRPTSTPPPLPHLVVSLGMSARTDPSTASS